MPLRKEELVPRVVISEQDRFLSEFRLKRPVVLSDGLENWPKVLFSFEQLSVRFGDQQVLTYKLPQENLAARMSSNKRDFFVWTDEGGDRDHLHRWSFREFVNALQNGEPHYCMANRTKNTTLRDLLAAEAGEVDYGPVSGTRSDVAHQEFFFGSKNAGPGLHHDGAVESFICQLIGTKRVNLFSPSDIPHLYPADSWISLTGHFSAVADSFNVNTGTFPLFDLATTHRCQLEPGDILYLPPHWYHDPSPLGPTVSMTIRNAPPPEIWGTAENREAVARAAEALYECLQRLPPAVQPIYSAFLRHDLAKKEPTRPIDDIQN